jgi:hypothetical protein
MIKFVALLKRREGMSYEDFKDYYKSNHSQLRSTIPDLPKSSCVKTERKFLKRTDHPIDNATAGNAACVYDAILEKSYESMADLHEDMGNLGHEDVWPIYLEDENKLFDRRYSVCYIVEEVVDR